MDAYSAGSAGYGEGGGIQYGQIGAIPEGMGGGMGEGEGPMPPMGMGMTSPRGSTAAGRSIFGSPSTAGTQSLYSLGNYSPQHRVSHGKMSPTRSLIGGGSSGQGGRGDGGRGASGSGYGQHNNMMDDPEHVALRAVLKREEVVGELYESAAAMTDPLPGARAAAARDMPEVWEAASTATMDVVEAVVAWRRHTGSAAPFVWNGEDYLSRIGADLYFLKNVPGAMDAIGFAPGEPLDPFFHAGGGGGRGGGDAAMRARTAARMWEREMQVGRAAPNGGGGGGGGGSSGGSGGRGGGGGGGMGVGVHGGGGRGGRGIMVGVGGGDGGDGGSDVGLGAGVGGWHPSPGKHGGLALARPSFPGGMAYPRHCPPRHPRMLNPRFSN